MVAQRRLPDEAESASPAGADRQQRRSDYAADDYLRNKDEHGLTRDDLDDLGYHNNPHAQYDE